MSKSTNTGPRPDSPEVTPFRVRRASSSPLTTSTRSPDSRSSRATNSARLAASRTALVATMRTRTAPRARADRVNSATAAAVRRIGSGASRPAGPCPSPSRVTRWVWRSVRQPVPSGSTTSRRTVLVPRSTVARGPLTRTGGGRGLPRPRRARGPAGPA